MSILDRILDTKRREVAELHAQHSMAQWRALAEAAPAGPSFAGALTAPGGPHLIAEVKKASPSKGVLRADFDPVAIAGAYASAGAAALSVLTDREYFQGHVDYLAAIRHAVAVPLLRKDFIIDDAQIMEARIAGASAVLLIAAALAPAELRRLHEVATGIGLGVLVEIHDDDDLARVIASGARPAIMGINNRDLRTFNVDLAVTERLAPKLDFAEVIVAESGLFTPDDVARVAAAGARAILVGESLMRQADIAAATRALMAPVARGARR